MKKILLICALAFICLSASAIGVHATQSSYGVTVETAGTGSAKCFYNDDGTITFYADETEEPFIFWNVQGDYELLENDYTDRVFTIRPLSNLRVTASYESAQPHKVMTSPQTGDKSKAVAFIIIMGSVVVCIAIIKLWR